MGQVADLSGQVGDLSHLNRPALRQEALQWLAADLVAWRKMLAVPKASQTVHRQMTHWLSYEVLAAVRDEEKLKKLPSGERRDWEQLWADVRKLRDETMMAEDLPLPKVKLTQIVSQLSRICTSDLDKPSLY